MQVVALRDEKMKIREDLVVLNKKLADIHKEIPVETRREAPTVRESDPSEFPERDFEINVTLTIQEDEDEEPKPEPVIVLEPPDFDHYEGNILPRNTKKFDAKDPGDVCHLDFDSLCNFSKNEKKDTPWEDDIRSRRLQRKFFEQDEMIEKMRKTINDFDNKLEKLNSEKFKTEVNARLMDLFVVTLHQELIILKEFEALEGALQDKVNKKISEVLDMRDIIDDIGTQIIERNKTIDKSQDECKQLQTTFLQAVVDNKFYDFLRKVFRKKYKPPRVHKDDGEVLGNIGCSVNRGHFRIELRVVVIVGLLD